MIIYRSKVYITAKCWKKKIVGSGGVYQGDSVWMMICK